MIFIKVFFCYLWGRCGYYRVYFYFVFGVVRGYFVNIIGYYFYFSLFEGFIGLIGKCDLGIYVYFFFVGVGDYIVVGFLIEVGG